MRVLRCTVLAAVAFMATACGGSDGDDKATATTSASTTTLAPSTTAAPAATTTTLAPRPATTVAASVASRTGGYWEGSYGGMVIRVAGDTVRGAYGNGSVVLTAGADGVLRGWWCHPGCTPPSGAGEVEFRVAGDKLDGRWRYGTTGSWNESWELTRSSKPAPASLEAKFNDPTLFKSHP